MVEVSNLVFSCIFTVEMILKLTAYGFVQYVSDGFNVFDGFIVCLGSMELYNGIVYGVTEEGSGLSVLRTFRLLRILKLVRFLPNLRRQLIVMLKTMDNVAVFFGLLALFIFIFRFKSKLKGFMDSKLNEMFQYFGNEFVWLQVCRPRNWNQ